MTADPKMLGGLGDNPFWNFRRQGGLIYGSNPWYGMDIFWNCPLGRGYSENCLGCFVLVVCLKKTFTFKPIKVGKTLVMMKA